MSTTLVETITSRGTPNNESIILKTLRPVGNRSVTKSDEDGAVTVTKVQNVAEETVTPQPAAAVIRRRELDSTTLAKVKRRENFQFAALCVPLFLAGYNDGSTGPLLPTIQRVYHVNFAIVSLLFVCSCIGFVSGALSNVWFTERYGFGKTLALGYAINGFGISLQDAQSNGFVTTMYDSKTKMNFLHAAYGFGALTAPVIATPFANFKRWSLYYCSSLGLAIFTFVVLALVFKFQSQDVLLAKNGHPPSEHVAHPAQHSTMRQIMGLGAVHTMAVYLLVYVGVEVTLGGWIVTYIIDKRGGNHNSGYISSGFFGGLTLGRMVLHFVTRFIPEKHTVYLYAVLCLALELTIWLVPSLIGNAISVSFIGFLLGPLYPIAMNQAGQVIPQRLLTGSIGWMAGFGQAGSALLPFITGALANKFGISSLQPLSGGKGEDREGSIEFRELGLQNYKRGPIIVHQMYIKIKYLFMNGKSGADIQLEHAIPEKDLEEFRY
ncbi:hypothetical protein Clacol_009990 [Clathrus columnatus]|uniref:Major facilitator superfamily (MFS) profile domain-containing protein n=1 Tax=Clathrus columnatus TaxID=1419009 RepID=A0AAV5APK5_9AGAM|nr:hypothetical protein Clacol_009990 [Clathrus columnatus]